MRSDPKNQHTCKTVEQLLDASKQVASGEARSNSFEVVGTATRKRSRTGLWEMTVQTKTVSQQGFISNI